MTHLPSSILTWATMMRANFGQGVSLKFAADERTGATRGDPAWDDPAAEIARDKAREAVRDLGSL